MSIGLPLRPWEFAEKDTARQTDTQTGCSKPLFSTFWRRYIPNPALSQTRFFARCQYFHWHGSKNCSSVVWRRLTLLSCSLSDDTPERGGRGGEKWRWTKRRGTEERGKDERNGEGKSGGEGGDRKRSKNNKQYNRALFWPGIVNRCTWNLSESFTNEKDRFPLQCSIFAEYYYLWSYNTIYSWNRKEMLPIDPSL